ncbi:hypothetical protein [Ammoniphilus sp. YIM 78166]|nr:hypothetical protein [Ammoniphilus sp. YIM 78166]
MDQEKEPKKGDYDLNNDIYRMLMISIVILAVVLPLAYYFQP